MGLITGIGRILTLLAGLFILLIMILGLLNIAFNAPAFASLNLFTIDGVLGIVIYILIGAVLFGIGLKTIKIDETAVEGIVVIILAFIINSTLALVGGILILVGGLVEN